MAGLPKKIGRYQILAEIGRGGMGVVYKARDPNIGRVVALKVIHLTFDADDQLAAEMKERFKREAAAAGILQHPNVVSVYDAGEVKGVSYIALEYVEGVTLESLMVPGEMMPVAKVCSILSQAARGIAFAHGKGIVHRDVKPANIIISESGEAKIMDFGVARVVGSELTDKGMVLGSPSYMSPEQITGQTVDHKSDIFSLGVILYQLLTGDKPFPGDSPTSIGYRIVQTEPIEPTKVNPVISPAFNLIISHALAKRPENRYDSAEQMARDLEAAAAGNPLDHADDVHNAVTRPMKAVELPAEGDSAPGKPFPLRRLIYIAAAVLLAAAAVIGAYFLIHDPYAEVRKLIADGRHADAVAELLKDQALRPKDAESFYLLGREYVELNDFDKSVAAYGEALKLKPGLADDETLQKDLVMALAMPDAKAAVRTIALDVGEPIAPRLADAMNNPDYNTHWNAARALSDMGRKVDKLPLYLMDYKTNPDCTIRKAAEKAVRASGDSNAIADLEQAKKTSTLPSCESKTAGPQPGATAGTAAPPTSPVKKFLNKVMDKLKTPPDSKDDASP